MWRCTFAGRVAVRQRATPRLQVRSSLPILMYHSISDEGPVATARYRVRPDAFEAQLRYSSRCRFHHSHPQSMAHRRPAPAASAGEACRSSPSTMDIGTSEANAWPLLQRYGFGALVFLVTDLIGEAARWDADLGEPLPLMGWDEIRRLASQGVEFGAHSASLSSNDGSHSCRDRPGGDSVSRGHRTEPGPRRRCLRLSSRRHGSRCRAPGGRIRVSGRSDLPARAGRPADSALALPASR